MSEINAHLHQNKHEHSIPWFWPLSAAIELGAEGLKIFQDNLRFIEAEAEIIAPPPPQWATKNKILLDLDTMRLRDFSVAKRSSATLPVLIDAPYAGHSSTIADYAKNQSLVETLIASGLEQVMVTDWKSATKAMCDYNIDKYLSELNIAIDKLGGIVNLVGLCQGGWLSAMYAARYPSKVNSLVLAGSPIDTHAGDGPLKKMVQKLPLKFFQEMVSLGGGLMHGRLMLAGWKNMHPEEQYLQKYLDLYQHIENRNYIERTELFERWYENPIDLPGAYYLQAVEQLFMKNRFFNGEFFGLGKTLSLHDITCPVYLMAGADDDITLKEQVFAAESRLGTPPEKIVKALVPGGHIGLFMGRNTLAKQWPLVAQWIRSCDAKEES